jgi:glycosyltransferase involved in cell wall biosynthesis
MTEVAVLTHFPSPYQVELFDAVARKLPGLAVHYLHRSDPARHWAPQAPGHDARFLVDGAGAMARALQDAASARLMVFNYYQDGRARGLMRARAATGKPWVFWGERPGYRNPRIGRWLRRWWLRPLHASRQPIWGIGAWAVQAYREEFGQGRAYANIPYFSSLAAFEARPASPSAEPVVLYSGSLSRRKGVDLLARAFARVAREHPRARLRIMGRGDLEPRLRATLAPVADRVDWLGFQPWDALAGVYASAQVLCAPSRHDGWGLVVAEGLACGLPVIATNRMGAAIDLLRPGDNGWRCKAGDEGELARALGEALSMDEARWRRMSAAARASVAHHRLEDGADRFVAAVNSALET